MSSSNDRRAVLKSAILRGVFEDNREILGQGTGPGAGRRGAPAKNAAARIVLAVLVGLFTLLPRPDFDPAPEAAVPPLTAAPLEISGGTRGGFGQDVNLRYEIGGVADAQGVQPDFNSSVSELGRQPRPDYQLLLNDGDVRLSSLFGLAVQTIVIDPGHGGRDPGAIGASGASEKDLTLDIALRLRDRLDKAEHYKVVLTRKADETVGLSERVKLANRAKPDLFISIHINSLPQKTVNVIETYYFGPPVDEETLRVAERENQGSQYDLQGFRAIIQKIGDRLKRQESAALASSIQRSLFTNVREYDADVRDVGVKIAPFVVLLGVDAPAVLAEISCLTNADEEAKLKTPEYREKIASFLEQGINRYVNRRRVHARRGHEHKQKIDG